MEIRNKIIAATQEIFTSMIMMDPQAGDPPEGEINPLKTSVTGMVGMAGTYKGVLAVHLPESLAMKVTGNFLGLEIEEINEDVKDAIGELANMLGGSVKMILAENGKDIKLSLPSIVSGQEYTFQSHNQNERVLIPFQMNEGDFLIELRLEKDG